MSPLVRLSDVSVSAGGTVVLSGVNWAVRAGEVWAVTGPNGAGKSTLLRVLAGETWHAGGERVFALEGRETRSPLGARERVALVSPELGDWYLRHDWTVSGLQVVLGGVTGTRLPPFPPRPEHEAVARAAAARAGVTDLLDTDVRSLSQGQRRRVLLARALASAPRVLVLDEVWEGVDAASTAHLRAVVAQEIAGGLTVVYSTHRTEEFLPGTTGHLRVEGGSVARAPLPGGGPRRAPRPTVPAPQDGRVLLRVEHADVYREGTHAVKGLSWTWREEQHWALLGPNGAGKSSVARLVAGELFPAVGGRVERMGLSARATLEQRRLHVGLVSAETQAQLLRAAAMRDRVTGEVVVASGFGGTVALAEPLTDARRERLIQVTGVLGIGGLLDRDVEGLSHGQLKRLLLARAFVHTPPLLVLDEPFDYLDVSARAGLDGLIAQAVAGGAHLLVIAHRPGDLPGVITHALVMQAGEVVYAGPLEAWGSD